MPWKSRDAPISQWDKKLFIDGPIISIVHHKNKALNKARKFADERLTDASAVSARKFEDDLFDVAERLAASGISKSSSCYAREAAKLRGKLIDEVVLAKLHGLLEGYELYGVPLDEQLASLTIDEVMNFKDAQIREGGRSITAVGSFETLDGLIQRECKVSRTTIGIEVERRRLSPKETKEPTVIVRRQKL